ncbi:uncharacterized protein VTP21DRAFT_6318 [Calcarisporiella thermophila]|uniref:uncharacterized protein n=1 Tax=Calcarisporiella thermophila TaxID=911321 RepID=UPI003742BE5C
MSGSSPLARRSLTHVPGTPTPLSREEDANRSSLISHDSSFFEGNSVLRGGLAPSNVSNTAPAASPFLMQATTAPQHKSPHFLSSSASGPPETPIRTAHQRTIPFAWNESLGKGYGETGGKRSSTEGEKIASLSPFESFASPNSPSLMGGKTASLPSTTLMTGQILDSSPQTSMNKPFKKKESDNVVKRPSPMISSHDTKRLFLNILAVLMIRSSFHSSLFRYFLMFLEGQMKNSTQYVPWLESIIYVILFMNIIDALYRLIYPKAPCQVVPRTPRKILYSPNSTTSPSKTTSHTTSMSSGLSRAIAGHSSPRAGWNISQLGGSIMARTFSSSSTKTPPSSLSYKMRQVTGGALDELSIRNQIDLDRLLDEENTPASSLVSTLPSGPLPSVANPTPATAVSSAIKPLNMRSTTHHQRYQTAPRASPSRPETSKSKHITGGETYFRPDQAAEKLKIHPFVEMWIENMRKWMSEKIVQHVASRIDQVDAELAKLELGHLSCSMASLAGEGADAVRLETPVTSGSLFSANTNATSTWFGSQSAQSEKPKTLTDLFRRFGNLPVVRERLKLEKYLTMRGYGDRAYIIERIKTLSLGGVLAAYRWDGGAVTWGDNKKWTPDQPTDAHLLMHLFCSFMDLATPGEGDSIFGSYPFTAKYFVPVEGKPDPSRTIQIKQLTKTPPHFYVVFENAIWDAYSRSDNLFHSLVLFVYLVRESSAGYLGLLNLGCKEVDILSVLEAYE